MKISQKMIEDCFQHEHSAEENAILESAKIVFFEKDREQIARLSFPQSKDEQYRKCIDVFKMVLPERYKQLNYLIHCPITLNKMREPVSAEDGHIYEKKSIESWLRNPENKGLSPFTRQPMKLSNIERLPFNYKIVFDILKNTYNEIVENWRPENTAIQNREQRANISKFFSMTQKKRTEVATNMSLRIDSINVSEKIKKKIRNILLEAPNPPVPV